MPVSESSRRSRKNRERLIESHLPLVRAVARRYTGRGETLDDLVQVGAVGLIKASDRFDPGRGVSFASFATPAVEGEIRRHLGNQTTSLRIPRELQRMTGQLRHCRADLGASLGRVPTVEELAQALGVDERDVERGLEAERARDPVSMPDEGGAEVVAEHQPLAGSEDRLLLANSIRDLDEPQRRIVFLRFHADMTEREIARAVGISQAQVSRRLAAALAQLRKRLANRTDIAREAAISTPPADKSDTKHSNPPPSTITIAPVGAAEQQAELDRFLALPYHVSVKSEGEDGRLNWVAAVEELAGCAARGSTPDEAVQRLRPAMERWFSTALAERREIPVPGQEPPKRKPAPSHSGRFLIRMPSELHQELAMAAEREQVSLNRFITDVLAASLADDPAPEASSPEPYADPEPPPKASANPERLRAFRVALATNIVVVVFAGLVALALLILAVERGL